MKIIFIITILSASLLSFSLLAEGGGDRVGNGGDVVLCTEGDSREVLYILEEYESLKSLGVGSPELDYRVKLNILLEKIRPYFPERYTYYKQILSSLKSNLTFSESSLPEINDAKESVGNSCEITQAAYFTTDINNKHHYFILKYLWNKLDEDQKAILLLHELLYTEGADIGHQTSYYIRKVNQQLFSGNKINPKAIDDLFIKPLKLYSSSASLIKRLKNAYTPAIAIFLLKQDFTREYKQEGLKKNLLLIRSRFNSNQEIKSLVEMHLHHLTL